MEEARGIVRAGPICSHHNGGIGLGIGVNPHGQGLNDLWQMDVTHYPTFGRLKYLHVTIYTFSHFIWASAQMGKKALHVKRHLLSCFAVMGVPTAIKTDNGPAYVHKAMATFMRTWNIKHITGIAHSPTGQAIVEHTNATLKTYLNKMAEIGDIKQRLWQTLYVLNHLCIFGQSELPLVIIHQGIQKKVEEKPRLVAMFRHPRTGVWEGPAEVQYFGRGYMCVLTPAYPVWVPSKWTKPAHERPAESGNSSTAPADPSHPTLPGDIAGTIL